MATVLRKRTRKGDLRCDADYKPARPRRGGDSIGDAAGFPAATKTNGSALRSAKTRKRLPSRAGSDPEGVNETNDAPRAKTKPVEKRGATDASINGQAAGDNTCATDSPAASRKNKSRTKGALKTNTPVSGAASGGGELPDSELKRAATCRQLQELQRRRAAALKCRIAADNQLAALVSTEMGYRAGLEEADRKAMRAKAVALITAMDKGTKIPAEYQAVADRVCGVVSAARLGRNGFDAYASELEKQMLKLAKSLPVSAWVEQADQRGFGLLSLATIIGETGDLSTYANPGKVWKRLGCAPIKGKMPSTWRKEGGLSAAEWTEAGYSPRRRSIVYVIGENIVKQNKGPYRKRYDDTKAAAKVNHPDWTDGHAHNHGMLLASKRLLRDLWIEWSRKPLAKDTP